MRLPYQSILSLLVLSLAFSAKAATTLENCGESIRNWDFLETARQEIDESLQAIDKLVNAANSSRIDREIMDERWIVELLDISDFIVQGRRIVQSRDKIQNNQDRRIVNGIVGSHYVHVVIRLSPILEHLDNAVPEIRSPALAIRLCCTTQPRSSFP
jgi:hypothetical protein